MKISGFQIKEAMKGWSLVESQLKESLPRAATKNFKEEKDSKEFFSTLNKLNDVSKNIQVLEVLQSKYNEKVKVDHGGKKVTLLQLIKSVSPTQKMLTSFQSIKTTLERNVGNELENLEKEKTPTTHVYGNRFEKENVIQLAEVEKMVRMKTAEFNKLQNLIGYANTIEVSVDSFKDVLGEVSNVELLFNPLVD